MIRLLLSILMVISIFIGPVSPLYAGDYSSSDILVAFSEGMLEASRSFHMKATAYTANVESTGKGPDHPAYGITFSGEKVQEGLTVAVDPNVIPLGSWIYIEGMGIFRADDTGGKIKGNRIDIYMEDVDQALQFGIQDVRVYLLEKS